MFNTSINSLSSLGGTHFSFLRDVQDTKRIRQISNYCLKLGGVILLATACYCSFTEKVVLEKKNYTAPNESTFEHLSEEMANLSTLATKMFSNNSHPLMQNHVRSFLHLLPVSMKKVVRFSDVVNTRYFFKKDCSRIQFTHLCG